MSNDNFYTPDWLIDELLEFYAGGLDLDPSADINKRIPAANHYTIKEDGLRMHWNTGTIFCNPPYSRSKSTSLDMWIDKALQSHEQFNTEILLLLPANTDTKWCQTLLSSDVLCLFFKSRIKFLDENYEPTKGTGKFASMLAYLGDWNQSFITQFGKHGVIK
ncbi:MAG: DNA N-6-adenine-methyltransferase [Microcoleus anatoxicus]|uniref:DNA N-6-adenine-methyltransferase n=1 Tax=Microcoleus anatoxicus TaxID=2705319 RepID=UPI003670878D